MTVSIFFNSDKEYGPATGAKYTADGSGAASQGLSYL